MLIPSALIIFGFYALSVCSICYPQDYIFHLNLSLNSPAFFLPARCSLCHDYFHQSEYSPHSDLLMPFVPILVWCMHMANYEMQNKDDVAILARSPRRTQIFRANTRYHLFSYHPNLTQHINYLFCGPSNPCILAAFFFRTAVVARYDRTPWKCLENLREIKYYYYRRILQIYLRFGCRWPLP